MANTVITCAQIGKGPSGSGNDRKGQKDKQGTVEGQSLEEMKEGE
jgi:hypothetical protein